MGRSARRLAVLAFASVAAFVALFRFGAAIPPPEAPDRPVTPNPRATPSPSPPAGLLPMGSDIFFVLDQKLSSGSSKPGSTIKVHLRDPLIVGGVTLAPAGTPATIDVLAAHGRSISDQQGVIQIHFEPLALPGREPLPIRAPREYLTIEMSGGQVMTQYTTDTIGQIFVPYYLIFQSFRPGHDYVLPAGAIVRAQTAATVDARNPNEIVIASPPPIVQNFDPPHADYKPAPFYTVPPTKPPPPPKPKPTRPPTPEPTDSPTPRASATPTGSPTPGP